MQFAPLAADTITGFSTGGGSSAPAAKPAAPAPVSTPDMTGLGPFASVFNNVFYPAPQRQTMWGGQSTDNIYNPFMQPVPSSGTSQQSNPNGWMNPWLGF